MNNTVNFNGSVSKDPRDVNVELFSNLLLTDQRKSAEADTRTNRDFNSYDIPDLESCSKNSESKSKYTPEHLKKDLNYYFPYLPTSEIDRVVNTSFWLIKEALKNYGYVQVPEFGKFVTYDRPYRIRYNVNTNVKYKVPQMKLRRVIEFKPSDSLKQLCTPRELTYMRVSPTGVDIKEFPDFFTSFAREKRHRRQGQVLIQKAFDEHFRFLGYDNAYISAIYNGDL